jgi:hypothetical protein
MRRLPENDREVGCAGILRRQSSPGAGEMLCWRQSRTKVREVVSMDVIEFNEQDYEHEVLLYG